MAENSSYAAGLTPRQKQAYDFIRSHILEHGICPSYAEIGEAIGLVKSNAYKLVSGLIQRGYLANNPNRIAAGI